jgi:hypothetical protein
MNNCPSQKGIQNSILASLYQKCKISIFPKKSIFLRKILFFSEKFYSSPKNSIFLRKNSIFLRKNSIFLRKNSIFLRKILFFSEKFYFSPKISIFLRKILFFSEKFKFSPKNSSFLRKIQVFSEKFFFFRFCFVYYFAVEKNYLKYSLCFLEKISNFKLIYLDYALKKGIMIIYDLNILLFECKLII